MFTIKEILGATEGSLIAGNIGTRTSGVSIDSRTVRAGELFVAIKGKRFDGHSFIEEARGKGARAILFSDLLPETTKHSFKHRNLIAAIKVKDTVYALGNLAHFHRMRFRIPIIAVTGSNGKTTTKEMLSAILRKRFKVLSNPGTQNNHIGVPQAIFNLRKEHNLAVIEIGAGNSGEIDRLSWIIKPTIGIITNIGPSHLKFLKSLKGVLKTKLELLKNLAGQKEVIINGDDRLLSQVNGTSFKKVTFGLNHCSDFYGKVIRQTKKHIVFLLNGKYHIALKALGTHNVYNALASTACARSLGIKYREIISAFESFRAPPMRMQIQNLRGITVINDCYNSNPESLKCALRFLSNYPCRGRKIIICGDMLELGQRAKELHSNIGKIAAKSGIDFLITTGALAKEIAKGAKSAGLPRRLIRSFRNTTEAANFLLAISKPQDTVLIKGSRIIKMESIIKCFTSSSIR